MKIAFIVSGFPSLSETFILNQITGLLDMGHDVRIYARLGLGGDVVPADVEKYRLDQRVNYPVTIPRNKILARLRVLMLLLPALIKSPSRTFRVVRNLVRRKGGFSYRLFFLAMDFLRERYDIIQCHFGPNGNIGASLKQIGIDARVITTFHGHDVTSYVRLHGADIYQDLFHCGDLFIYNSEATKEKILQLGCPSDKMKKIPMGIHSEKITFAERVLPPDGVVNILSVGRLVEMKGREYAIRAVAKICENYPNIRYTIAGDGELRDSLQGLIDQLGAFDSIKLLGWVSDRQLDSLYSSAHIFLHPSVQSSDGNMEGQGVVLVEAQAYGLPIIATCHNAFTETVLDGESGFLVPERDVDAIAERLSYLIDNPHTWPAIGRAGRQYVCEKYDIAMLNRRLADIYEQLLKQSGPEQPEPDRQCTDRV